MLEGSAEEAHKFGESTFMIYTGAPQNTRRKSIEDLNITKVMKLWKNMAYLISWYMRLIL